MKTVRSVVMVLVCLISYQPNAQEAINEDMVIVALRGFFTALSVENYPDPKMKDRITDDFLIFEMGKAFSWERFQYFLNDAGYSAWTSTRWQFSEARVSLSGSSAHVSYVNTGEFVYPDPDNPGQALRERNVWLESAYLVREEGRLRLKFLQSDNVSREIEALP
ncbi:MAG: hypothetical protein P8J81_07985 [Luminiphilus sp.]|nr:hypothetical protein [Luminiphilus sp.]MDG2136203.1 hypothetical protein [Luminiphilus sp.]